MTLYVSYLGKIFCDKITKTLLECFKWSERNIQRYMTKILYSYPFGIRMSLMTEWKGTKHMKYKIFRIDIVNTTRSCQACAYAS